MAESTASKAASTTATEPEPAPTYDRVEWRPGIFIYRSLITGHTEDSEYDIIQYHADLARSGVYVPA